MHRALDRLSGAALATPVLVAVFASLAVAATPGARRTGANTPSSIANAQDLGAENASKVMTVRAWLRWRNEGAVEAALQQLYDPRSPNYHKWLSQEEIDARFSPGEEAVSAVRAHLEAQGLRVSPVASNARFVEARGRVADIQKAFGIQIHRFKMNGRTFSANTSAPTISGRAAALVASVGGLTDRGYRPHLVHPLDANRTPVAPVPLSAVPDGFFFSAQCFRKPEVHAFNTNGVAPLAVYHGNRYGADITNEDLGTQPPCGYQPSEVQTAYGLNALYAKGLDGTGQSIVIVDAFGSDTITEDASFFSDFYGLSPLDLEIVEPLGPPAIPNQGWAEETTLDVEWSHAVAPGAKIVLEVAPTNSFDDLDAAVLDAVVNGRGNVISNSYGAPESLLDPADRQKLDNILKLAALKGIAVNYSSGDDGDFSLDLGYGDVSYPSSSPWATGLGGTSLALKKDNTLAFQTGWGTNITVIAGPEATGSLPAIPPQNQGFLFGAGGGASGAYFKPFYQRKLPGKARLVPDISYLADPYTGVEIILTVPGHGLAYGTIGGTSLSCPMFSGLWAIAAQRAGRPLGQAATRVYDLPDRAINDVVPFFSFDDVSGFTLSPSGFTFESAADLAAPLFSTKAFYSAFYQGASSTRWFVLTFGTDTSLNTRFGWDNVTGLGTPNGKAFVDAVASQH